MVDASTRHFCLPTMTELALNCLIHGDESRHLFAVEILPDEPVSVLKNKIKELFPSKLGGVDVSALQIFPVSLGFDNLDSELHRLDLSIYTPLSLFSTISDFPGGVQPNRLHIVVEVQQSRKRPRPDEDLSPVDAHARGKLSPICTKCLLKI